eukprot:gnl/TRDRNA2_/TRDRNA2_35697_c0_seq1.p1 gnl/TRDRNA2_/TRDRNA2_35697_c0~~gnl/TRDRNA2_/TRDRNA2_35697_c0_seq1.p1  ORF type:complete len:685 (-),score=131.24 gnl/TRDRNA2_/TRDRNA2_35697_c0_seq1:103-2157(-)
MSGGMPRNMDMSHHVKPQLIDMTDVFGVRVAEMHANEARSFLGSQIYICVIGSCSGILATGAFMLLNWAITLVQNSAGYTSSAPAEETPGGMQRILATFVLSSCLPSVLLLMAYEAVMHNNYPLVQILAVCEGVLSVTSFVGCICSIIGLGVTFGMSEWIEEKVFCSSDDCDVNLKIFNNVLIAVCIMAVMQCFLAFFQFFSCINGTYQSTAAIRLLQKGDVFTPPPIPVFRQEEIQPSPEKKSKYAKKEEAVDPKAPKVALQAVLATFSTEGLPEGYEIPTKLLEAAFREIDEDHGGAIDAPELIKALKSCGLNASESATDKVLKDIDKDNDGDIDVEEFVAFFRSIEALGKFDKKREQRSAFLVVFAQACFVVHTFLVSLFVMLYIRWDPEDMDSNNYHLVRYLMYIFGTIFSILGLGTLIFPVFKLACGKTIGLYISIADMFWSKGKANLGRHTKMKAAMASAQKDVMTDAMYELQEMQEKVLREAAGADNAQLPQQPSTPAADTQTLPVSRVEPEASPQSPERRKSRRELTAAAAFAIDPETTRGSPKLRVSKTEGLPRDISTSSSYSSAYKAKAAKTKYLSNAPDAEWDSTIGETRSKRSMGSGSGMGSRGSWFSREEKSMELYTYDQYADARAKQQAFTPMGAFGAMQVPRGRAPQIPGVVGLPGQIAAEHTSEASPV